MNQAKADASDDLFTTETAGLPEVLGPDVTRLADGDRLDLRIGPVRKNIDGAELRMLAYNGSIPGPVLHVDQGSEITVQVRNDGDVEATVHWHGLRLENQYDGVPDETQVPIPIGGTYTCKVRFPDAGFYWYHPHIREDFGLEMGLYGTIVVEPADPGYWPAADRELTLTLDDLLVEDGHIAPFSRSGPTFVAMGRYGNVMLINGETRFSGRRQRARSCACMWSTPRTRGSSTSPSAAPAPSWSAATAAGTSARRSPARYCSRRPSARSSTCCSTPPGKVRLEHRTPDHVYDLGGFTVTDGAPGAAAGSFETLRTDPELTAEHQAIGHDIEREPDKVLAFYSLMPLLYGGRRHAGILLRLPDAPRGHRRRAGDLPQVRDEAGGGAGRGRRPPTPARCTPRSPPPSREPARSAG